MEKWKKEYEEIKVPEELKDKIEFSVHRAQREKRRRKRSIYKTFGSMAAVLAVVLILPNTSREAAAAMQQIPVLGNFFKVITVREYQVEEDHYIADVQVPVVVSETPEGSSEEVAQEAQQSVDAINFDIQKATDELIQQFQEEMESSEEGYRSLDIKSTVLTDNDRWFSLELVMFEASGSGYERHRHYTIDKTTGKQPALADFYGDDYVNVISEEVKNQMRAQMAADENIIYWVDDPDMGDENFRQIAENQDFYVNADGHVVICFNEYEVAPGFMGCVEFVLADTVE